MVDPDWYNTPEKRASVNAQRDEQERRRIQLMEEARLEEARQLRLRLLSYEQKLVAAGIDMDELIELIEARQNGTY
jgi:hypothetical protein